MNSRFLFAAIGLVVFSEYAEAKTRLIAPVERVTDAQSYSKPGDWNAGLSLSGTLPIQKPYRRVDGSGEDFEMRALSGVGLEFRYAQQARWDSGLRIQYSSFSARAAAAVGSLTQFESASLSQWAFDLISELRFGNSGFVPLLEGGLGLARSSFELDSTDVSIQTQKETLFRPRASIGIGGAMIWWEPLRLKLTAGVEWQHLGQASYSNSVFNVSRASSLGGVYMRSSLSWSL